MTVPAHVELESGQAASTAETLAPAVEVHDLVRTFGPKAALAGVDLVVRPGQVHALLGRNGAGKTTLLRTLVGLVDATSGMVRLQGVAAPTLPRASRARLIQLVPSGDRTFYLRLSGRENLLFFARLQGMGKAAAREQVARCIESVGLTEAARRAVSTYSHGMQKRLSVARALLTEPAVLLVDEATHDLDPAAAEQVRSLIRSVTGRGAAVIWATQRLDEIRGFADEVTLLRQGRVRFHGTVEQLQHAAVSRRLIMRLQARSIPSLPVDQALSAAGDVVELDLMDDHQILTFDLHPDVVLSAAVMALHVVGWDVLACRRERSELESAFLELTEEAG